MQSRNKTQVTGKKVSLYLIYIYIYIHVAVVIVSLFLKRNHFIVEVNVIT